MNFKRPRQKFIVFSRIGLGANMLDFGSVVLGSNPSGTHQFFDKFFMMHLWMLLLNEYAKYALQLQKSSEMKLKTNSRIVGEWI